MRYRERSLSDMSRETLFVDAEDAGGGYRE
jgi:hypothetical protein